LVRKGKGGENFKIRGKKQRRGKEDYLRGGKGVAKKKYCKQE